MTRQNRTIAFLLFFSLVILAGLLWTTGVLDQFHAAPEDTIATQKTEEPGPETMGEPLGDKQLGANEREDALAFAQITSDLAECFEMTGGEPGREVTPTTESLLQELESNWGPLSKQGDRWMTWHLRAKEGREKRYRLEVSESADGQIKRRLQAFHVDREGLPIPLDSSDDARFDDPTDETLNQILKDGEVFYKEHAGFFEFAETERAEYLESDGKIQDFEVVKGDRIFKCTSIKNREACTCTR